MVGGGSGAGGGGIGAGGTGTCAGGPGVRAGSLAVVIPVVVVAVDDGMYEYGDVTV